MSTKTPKTSKVIGEFEATREAHRVPFVKNRYPILHGVSRSSQKFANEFADTIGRKAGPDGRDLDVVRPCLDTLEALLRAEGARPGYLPTHRTASQIENLCSAACGRGDHWHRTGISTWSTILGCQRSEVSASCKASWQGTTRMITRELKLQLALIESLKPRAPKTAKATESEQKAS